MWVTRPHGSHHLSRLVQASQRLLVSEANCREMVLHSHQGLLHAMFTMLMLLRGGKCLLNSLLTTVKLADRLVLGFTTTVKNCFRRY